MSTDKDKTLLAFLKALKQRHRQPEQAYETLTMISMFIHENKELLKSPHTTKKLVKQITRTVNNNQTNEPVALFGLTLLCFCLPQISNKGLLSTIYDCVKSFPFTLHTKATVTSALVILDYLLFCQYDFTTAQLLNIARFTVTGLNKFQADEQAALAAMRVLLSLTRDRDVTNDFIERSAWLLVVKTTRCHKEHNVQLVAIHLLCRIAFGDKRELLHEPLLKHFTSRLDGSIDFLEPVLAGIWSLTRSTYIPDELDHLVDELTEILQQQAESLQIVTYVFGILSNLIDLLGKAATHFGSEELFHAVIKAAIFQQKDAVCQRLAIHLLRLASFRTDIELIVLFPTVCSAMVFFEQDARIVEDGCVVCYNVWVRDPSYEQKVLEALARATVAFPDNKVVHATHFAVSHGQKITFVK